MKRFKNYLALSLAVILIISLTACGRKTATGYYVDDSDIMDAYTDSSDETQATGSDAANGTTSGGKKTDTTNSNSGTTEVDRSKESIWKIKQNVKPQASSSIMKNLNFKGKTFKMLVYNDIYTPGDKAIIAEFSKKYNCKVEVDLVNYEDYPSVLTTSLAGGKPYDIIKLHCGFFPLIATSRVAQPLEKAISSEDLTTATNSVGINWEATLNNAAWNNHIYYVLDHRVGPLQIMYYNKLLFRQYGLEDPLELYKKGQWTVSKIEEYAKIVNASGGSIKLYNDAVSNDLVRVNYPNGAFYFFDIAADGTVKWLGANTELANYYQEKQRLRALSPLYDTSSTVDTIVNGQCMLSWTVAEKLNIFESRFKTSQALGNDLNNLGVVPFPLDKNGKYITPGPEGFAAARGCDPTAAVALSIFYSMQSAAWEKTNIPALTNNKGIFNDIYNKFNVSRAYVFRVADGRKGDEVIYPMYGQIEKGGDIMRLLQEYAPQYKAAVEYSLSNQ